MQKIKCVPLILYLLAHAILCANFSSTLQLLSGCSYHYPEKKGVRVVTPCNYSECLTKAIYFLCLLDQHNYCYCVGDCSNQKDCIQIDSTSFFDPHIQNCIQKMHTTQSLHPIVVLLDQLTHHSFYHDAQFIRELFLLIFTIHKQIFLEKYIEQPQPLKTVNLNTILEIAEKINQLPIAEILNAIDMLVNELPPFLEKYEFNSKISWKEWLKKYWWVPPIFGGWFALKVLLSLQRPHYYFSPYLSSRPTVSLPPITTNDPVLAEIIIDTKK